jgi:hypothetical protein
MSNPGLNAVYNGAFAQGLQMGNSIGLGRHRRHGGGFMDFLKKANTFVKENQLISKGLNVLEQTGLADKLRESQLGSLALKGASMAAQNGYGRRRRRTGGRRKIGAGVKVIVMAAPKRRKATGRRRRVGRPRKYY